MEATYKYGVTSRTSIYINIGIHLKWCSYHILAGFYSNAFIMCFLNEFPTLNGAGVVF